MNVPFHKGHPSSNLYRRGIGAERITRRHPYTFPSLRLIRAVQYLLRSGSDRMPAMLGEALLALHVPHHAGRAGPEIGLIVQPINSSSVASSSPSATRRSSSAARCGAASTSPHPGHGGRRPREAEHKHSAQACARSLYLPRR
jgi:hypothetical protein